MDHAECPYCGGGGCPDCGPSLISLGFQCGTCGCSDADPCPGGDFWVEEDLCSSCVILGVIQGGYAPRRT